MVLLQYYDYIKYFIYTDIFQLKFTNFINNIMFHSLNEIVSCNKIMQKFFKKHERRYQAKLKIKTKLAFGCEKQIKIEQNLI